MTSIVARMFGKQSRHALNFASFLLTRLFTIGLYAVSVPFFINRTSAAEYGAVAIGFSLLGLSSLLDVAVGYVVTQSVARRLARTGKADNELFSNIFWAYSVTATAIVLTTIALFAIADVAGYAVPWFYAWLILLLPALAISGTVAAVFQGHNELVYLNSSRFGFEIGKALSLIFSAIVFGSHEAVGAALFLFAVIRATIDLRELRRRLGYAPNHPSLRTFNRSIRHLRIGLPALASVLLTLSVSIGDKLLIARWLTKADVAHYSLAFDINTKAYLLVNAVNTTMFATLVRNHALKKKSSRQIKIGLLAIGVVTLFYYLPLMFFAQKVISWWVNPGFAAQTFFMVRVMAFSSVCYLIGNLFENALLARGHARVIFKIYGFAVGAYFLSVRFLSDKFGVHGFSFAYALLSATFLAGTFYSYHWYKPKKS